MARRSGRWVTTRCTRTRLGRLSGQHRESYLASTALRGIREGYEAAARYEQRSEWAEVFTHDNLAYVNAVLDDETLAAFKFARVASLPARQQGEVERQRRENEANVRSVGQSYAARARARLDYKQGRGEGVEGALPMRSLSPLELMLHLSTKRSF